jgi:alkanesulfonate monooxygenase SsuD/methylene tetrahydromethanopterin reductase-like flavin-dependent oxidoreductase (luciferase family)
VEDGPRIVESYRRRFCPSPNLAEPRVNVAVHALCAETEEEALRLAASRNLMKLRSALGERQGVPSVEEALLYPYRPEELAYLEQVTQAYIDGHPQQVKDNLDDLAQVYQTTDLTVVTICYDFAARIRSYELVAEVCELKR